jgi:hypothetical protein
MFYYIAPRIGHYYYPDLRAKRINDVTVVDRGGFSGEAKDGVWTATTPALSFHEQYL